jgi:hypothetical protein
MGPPDRAHARQLWSGARTRRIKPATSQGRCAPKTHPYDVGDAQARRRVPSPLMYPVHPRSCLGQTPRLSRRALRVARWRGRTTPRTRWT